MREGNYIAITITLFSVILMALWLIDVSVSAILTESILCDSGINVTMILTNGFYTQDPVKMYHVGLWIVIFCCFSIVLIAINAILS